MATNRARYTLIALFLMSTSGTHALCQPAQVPPRPDLALQSKVDPPRPITNNLELTDWNWQDGLIVSSEPHDEGHRIVVLTIREDSVIATGRTLPDGRYPVLLPEDRLAYIEGGRHLVVTSLAAKDELPQRVKLGERGLIGEMASAAGLLFFYSLPSHDWDAKPTIFCFDPVSGRLSNIGTGFYPRTRDGEIVYFVSATRQFDLLKDKLTLERKFAGAPSLVSPGPVYFPQVVPGRPMLVVQRGHEKRRIDLIQEDGNRIRTLSAPELNGTCPQVSPSGSLVAFATYAAQMPELISVEVVSLDGRRLYRQQSGTRLINAAFRWSTNDDHLAVVVHSATEERALQIISFSRIGE